MEPDDQDPSDLAGRLDSVEEEDNMQNDCRDLVPFINKKVTDEDTSLASEDEQRVALHIGEDGETETQIELGFEVKTVEEIVDNKKVTTKIYDFDWRFTIKVLGIILFIILVIVGAVILILKLFAEKSTPVIETPATVTGTPALGSALDPRGPPIKCSDQTVILTQERQEVTLTGVTYTSGDRIPELQYKSDMDGITHVYRAPAKLMITRNSTGKEIPIEASLKYMDQHDRTAICSYKLKVEGYSLQIIFFRSTQMT